MSWGSLACATAVGASQENASAPVGLYMECGSRTPGLNSEVTDAVQQQVKDTRPSAEISQGPFSVQPLWEHLSVFACKAQTCIFVPTFSASWHVSECVTAVSDWPCFGACWVDALLGLWWSAVAELHPAMLSNTRSYTVSRDTDNLLVAVAYLRNSLHRLPFKSHLRLGTE